VGEETRRGNDVPDLPLVPGKPLVDLTDTSAALNSLDEDDCSASRQT
jgi:hypothetical protein